MYQAGQRVYPSFCRRGEPSSAPPLPDRVAEALRDCAGDAVHQPYHLLEPLHPASLDWLEGVYVTLSFPSQFIP